ncbi:hypothetical protein J0H58_21925 [bacterium]|nr:hypothetical protein [bacterium]
MHPLLKRILLNGTIAASLLAVLGFGLTELARMWLVAQTPARAQPGAPAVEATDGGDALGPRVPLSMAAWGVGFVVVAELFLWFVLKRRPTPPPAPQPGPAAPDPAEVLLEQLMLEAESKQALATTPSPASSENTKA